MTSPHPPTLFHVGYIKTGTTFLQKRIFSQAGCGLGLAAGDQTRAQTVQNILLADDYCFDAAEIRDRMEAIASPVRAGGQIPVWSEESLLGNPPSRRYDGFSNARKVHAVFPKAKVLITIRQQNSIALSMYREYVRGQGTFPLRSFIGTGEEALSFTPILRPEFLCYDRAIRHYRELFGPQRVLVLPQEMLALDPARYVAALSEFAGCEVSTAATQDRDHVGEGYFALAVRRFVNRLVVQDDTRPGRRGVARIADRGVRVIDRLTPQGLNDRQMGRYKSMIEERYAGLFTESNRETARMTGLPLQDYGYDM